MKKRGQIAIFVILGISVIILVGFIGYIQSNMAQNKVSAEIKNTAKTPTETSHIKNFAESCLTEVSDRGLWIIGEYGGYINPKGNATYDEPGIPPEGYTTYKEKPVPYYIGGTPLTLGEIEGKLSKYILVEFEKCFNLTAFEDDGFFITLDASGVDSNITINEDSVTANINYPIDIKKKESETSLDNFRVDSPIRLGKIFKSINNTPNGLIPLINEEWGDGDEDDYDLITFDCDLHDPLYQAQNKKRVIHPFIAIFS